MKRSKDQKGMAMVSAIVLIAVIAIMASTLLQMSYLAYTRKVTERRTTETFYTAEAAVDTIKSYIQNTAASVLDEAKNGTADFAKAAYAKILGLANTDGLAVGTKIVVGADGSKPATLTALENLLKKKIFYKSDGTTKKNDSGYYNGHVTTDIYDGIVTNGGDFSIGGIEIAKEGVRIKDVHIKFINNEGYVAEITTDIVITAPTYAADFEPPVGTYSMFAGSGATVYADSSTGYSSTAMNNLLYLHQEGNLYIGTKKIGTKEGQQSFEEWGKRPKTALEIQAPARGAAYFSSGAKNAVFNGSVYVDNGNTLIFTGGDGKKDAGDTSAQANIQVNGYIYLSEGATLLIAPNVNLVCMGIKVRESETADYETYTGTNVTDDGISQFYPVAESSAGNLDDFDVNNEDQAEVLAKINSLGSATADNRATHVSQKTAKCAVYILDADRDDTKGWKDRKGDKYYLVKCVDNAFSCTQPGLYKNQIRCAEIDSMVDETKLAVVPKVVYKVGSKGGDFDAEFCKIVNIPVLLLWEQYANSILTSNPVYTNYNSLDDSTYETITFQEINEHFSYLGTNFTNKFNFNNMSLYGFSGRKLRIPTNTSKSSIDSGLFTVETSKRTYKANQNMTGAGHVGDNNGNIQPQGNDYGIAISASNVIVRTPASKHYVGLFMTSEWMKVGLSTGVTRGISLLEMAKKTKTHKGMDDEDNQVRKIITRLAGSWICKSYSEDWLNDFNGITETSEGSAFNLFDNLFNGGVKLFWEREKTQGDDDNSSSSDNSNVNFVDVDNWKKDTEPGAAEETTTEESGD